MFYIRSSKLAIILSMILSISFGINLTGNIKANSTGHILITEVLYDAPNSDATEEWFELFNPLNISISLEGWSVSDNVGSFSLTGTIPSGSYITIARDGTAFQSLYGFAANITGSTLALGNSGDLLRLFDASNNEIDMVAWENEVAGWDISAIDTTIRRISNSDSDTVSDWEASDSLGDPGSGPYSVVVPSDNIYPIVSIDNLIDGSKVSGNVLIQISATDNNIIASYQILINGGLKSTKNIFNWNTLTESDGSHSILARAQDIAGNWGEASINIIVDNSNYVAPDISPIKFMSYNIEQSGANPDWINVVKEENPDIIVFVETGNWDNGNDALLNQYILELNTYFVDETPYVGTTGQNIGFSTSGEAIMSRFPILSTTQLADVQLDDGTIYDVSHDFMIWEVDVGGEIIYVIGTHLKCCSGATNEVKREKAQEGIINYMDNLGDVPIIYAGDLNSFSPFDTGNLAPKGNLAAGPLTMMLKPQDPTYGEFSSEIHTFVDVYRELNPNTRGYTFGYQNPIYESRIDFIIANQYFFDDLINSTVGDEGPAETGSDHYTVDVFIEFDDNLVSNETNSTTSTISKTTSTTTNSITGSNKNTTSKTKETPGPMYLKTTIAVFTLSVLNSARSRSRSQKYSIK